MIMKKAIHTLIILTISIGAIYYHRITVKDALNARETHERLHEAIINQRQMEEYLRNHECDTRYIPTPVVIECDK